MTTKTTAICGLKIVIPLSELGVRLGLRVSMERTRG